MNTSYGLNAYRSHDLNISMRTSSGDVINMDFANKQELSMNSQKNENGSSSQMRFSSMQSFQFSMQTNGIDAKDQKEIDAFMKIAQPFIDDFLKELQDVAPKSPVTELANQIAGVFEPSRDRSDDAKANVKNNIVKMFDNSIQKLELPEAPSAQEMIDKLFKDAQKLLEKTLENFDNFNKNLYA